MHNLGLSTAPNQNGVHVNNNQDKGDLAASASHMAQDDDADEGTGICTGGLNIWKVIMMLRWNVSCVHTTFVTRTLGLQSQMTTVH